MKRKFKLITSIASLTAAVALLAVGAFAAGQRNVDVTGIVRFKAQNVNALIQVFDGYAAKAGGTVDYGEGEGGKGPIGVVEYKVVEGEQGSEEDDVLLGDDGEIELNDSRHKYSYKIKVTNTFKPGGYSILAVFSGFYPEIADGVTITAPTTTADTSVVIDAGESHEFIVTVTVDPTQVAPYWSAVLDANVALSIYTPIDPE